VSCFLYLISLVLTSLANMISIALSTDPLLVWNYGSMAVLALIAGILFWFIFQDLDAKEDELNEIPEGRYEKPLAA